MFEFSVWRIFLGVFLLGKIENVVYFNESSENNKKVTNLRVAIEIKREWLMKVEWYKDLMGEILCSVCV